MNNFWALTGYEYKKLLRRKIVWITLLLLGLFGIYSVFSSVMGLAISSEDGKSYTGWEVQDWDRSIAKEFEGEKINDVMLQKLAAMERTEGAGINIPDDLYSFVSTIAKKQDQTAVTGETFSMTADDLYEMRAKALETMWKEESLNQGEKEELLEMNKNLDIPLTNHYAKGYKKIVVLAYIIGLMQNLMIAVCVPPIFAEEHQRKTAQLIMCSKYGKRLLFWSKNLVGITFSVFATILLYITILIPISIIYGMEGFGTQAQVYFPMISWNLSMGQMVLIMAGLGLASAILQSVIVMALSEKHQSSTIPMAISVGFLMLTAALNIPYSKIISQIWDYMPLKLFFHTSAFSNKMVHVFGRYFGTWQCAPVFYLLLSVIAVLMGYRAYSRYQTKER